MKPYPPLGILYICAHLRQTGIQAEIFDSTFSTRQQLFEVIQKGPPSVLGVYANLMTRANVIDILRCAKDAGWQTVVGGPEPGAYIENYLDAGADFVVVGEGEISMRSPGQRAKPSTWIAMSLSGASTTAWDRSR